MAVNEVIFWLSPVGLQIGVSLVLPERVRRFRLWSASTITVLSPRGLIWALGYTRDPDPSRVDSSGMFCNRDSGVANIWSATRATLGSTVLRYVEGD